MNVWRWLGVVVFAGAVSLGVTAYAQQGGEKKSTGEKAPTFTFEKDDKGNFTPFWQEMTTTTNQTMKVQGMEVVQTQKQTFYVQWTPKSEKDNTWEVEYKIVGVKMDIQIGGNSISYDSTTKDQQPDNPLTQFFKALKDAEFKMTIKSADQKGMWVDSVDKKSVDDFVNKLAQANEQLKPLLVSILNPDALKDMSNPTFAVYPKTQKEWDAGKWNYDVKLNMGPIGSYDTKYTYTRNTKDEKSKSVIDVTASMEYSPPKSGDTGNLPFIIKKGELKADKDKTTGKVTLDPKTNRIVESDMNMELKGDLTIDIAGVETVVNLNQKQSSKVKTLNANPVAKTETPPTKKG